MSFTPGAPSIPDDTSTPHGRTVANASATFSAVRPPARTNFRPGFESANRAQTSQSGRIPLPPGNGPPEASMWIRGYVSAGGTVGSGAPAGDGGTGTDGTR